MITLCACTERTQPAISTRQNTNTNQPIRKAEIPQRVRNRLAKVTWYLGSKSANEVRLLLENQPEGTFLVRDSESANHMFSISSQTSRGTTSVRVMYDVKQDTFQLDVGAGFESKFASQSPRFSCITDVVNYLMKTSHGDEGHQCLCIESNGRRDTPFLLKHPYRRTHD